MGKYQRFEDMPVWQEAGRLYQRILDVAEESNGPLSATFRNQLERAALCVSNCVAEAFDAAGPSDTRPLLTSAREATTEVQSMIAIISERPKAARFREPLQQVRTCADSCSRQLSAWKYALDNPAPRQRQAPDGQGSSRPASGPAPTARPGAD